MPCNPPPPRPPACLPAFLQVFDWQVWAAFLGTGAVIAVLTVLAEALYVHKGLGSSAYYTPPPPPPRGPRRPPPQHQTTGGNSGSPLSSAQLGGAPKSDADPESAQLSAPCAPLTATHVQVEASQDSDP